MIGREAATLVNEARPAGTYTSWFHGPALTSGIGTARLTAGNSFLTRKVMKLK